MKVAITSRNYEIDESFRSFIKEKMDRLDRFFNKLLEAQVTLHVEKYRHSAEVNILANGTTLHGKEIANDMRTAFDKAADKLETQIKKYKEKLKEKKIREETDLTMAMETSELSELDEMEEQSIDKLKKEKYFVKSMWADDALKQFNKEGLRILIFKNADTERLNILFNGADGYTSLIEPHITG